MGREFPTDKIDINDNTKNATAKEKTYKEMITEDIVKGVSSEIEHEVWLRARKLNWKHQDVADYFNYSVNTVRNMLKSIDKKVNKFKNTVKMRGGNFIY